MTAITLKTIETKYAQALTGTDGQRIEFHPKAVEQMIAMRDCMVEITKYDPENLSELSLEIADQVADMFTPAMISGEVVDGVLMPITDELMEQALQNVRDSADIMDPAVAIGVNILVETVGKRGYFYR